MWGWLPDATTPVVAVDNAEMQQPARMDAIAAVRTLSISERNAWAGVRCRQPERCAEAAAPPQCDGLLAKRYILRYLLH